MNDKRILPFTSNSVSIKTTTARTTTPTEITTTTSTPKDSVLIALLRDQGPQAIGISLASLAYTALGKFICILPAHISISGPGPGSISSKHLKYIISHPRSNNIREQSVSTKSIKIRVNIVGAYKYCVLFHNRERDRGILISIITELDSSHTDFLT